MIKTTMVCDNCGIEVTVGTDESGDLSLDDFIKLNEYGWDIAGEAGLCPVCAAKEDN